MAKEAHHIAKDTYHYGKSDLLKPTKETERGQEEQGQRDVDRKPA